MNGDLEGTLNELGPEYRAVVARLRLACEVEPSTKHQRRSRESTSDAVAKAPGTFFRRVGYLVAASLFVALGLSIFMQDVADAPREPYAGAKVYTIAYAPTDEALEAIVASQRADGSWSNDFITRQNAAALRASCDERMRIAYCRAVRYLRFRGLSPLTDDELKVRGKYAAKVLAGSLLGVCP